VICHRFILIILTIPSSSVRVIFGRELSICKIINLYYSIGKTYSEKHRMRYTQLKAFYHVASQGGFSKAAAYLNLSQPSLSDHVRQLERDHDVLLFNRENRKVVLTPAGEELFLLARHFFSAEEVISEFLDRSQNTLKGRLRIIADSSAHITMALRRFTAAHPDILIELQAGNSAEVLTALRQYKAEIGIFVSGPGNPDLLTRSLGASPIIALAAPGYLKQQGIEGRDSAMLTWGDLARLPLIFRESGSQTQSLVIDSARRHGVKLKSAIVVEGREAMRDLVAEGFGIGFASEVEIGADSHLERLMLAEKGLEMTETLACLKARQNLPVIRALLASIDARAEG
jgi:DNA-binding transcriptional LysR family regulator